MTFFDINTESSEGQLLVGALVLLSITKEFNTEDPEEVFNLLLGLHREKYGNLPCAVFP